MAKRALPLLTGGLNEVTRSDLIEDSQLQVCDNYEITGDGILRRRKEPVTFDIMLDHSINLAFGRSTHGKIIKISEPFYPQTKLNPDSFVITTSIDFNTDPNTVIENISDQSIEMDGDYIIFVVGLLAVGQHQGEVLYSDEYTIHAFWQTNKLVQINLAGDKSKDWSNDIFWKETNVGSTFSDLLSEAYIKYPVDSVTAEDIEYTIGNNRVIINDSYNKMHYFEIDTDGIAHAGFLGIPAPLNKPQVLPLDSEEKRGNIKFEDVDFEDDSGADYVENVGLAQIVYTVVTKFGEESNPSPMSDALDLQWFKLNEATGANEIWIDSIKIYNLSIPAVPKSVENILESFKVYLRVTPYSQGDTAKTLTFSQEFSISAKSTEAEGTGNDYRMTVYPTTGNTASYENDVAPIAKTSSELGGIIMAGNVKTGHRFPFEFKYIHPITINNIDSNFYVEPWFRIRLYDESSTHEDAIENFKILR